MSQATAFAVPKRDQVSSANQAIFDKLESSLGMVPNLYATFANSGTALTDYLALANRRTSLRAKEKEVINLVVSQVNGCAYCLAAHTLLAQKAGLTEAQTLEIRRGNVSFDNRLDALARFTHAVVENRGQVSDLQRAELLDAGYNEENVVDVVMAIGDKTITNYLHNVTEVPVDFPAAPKL